MLAPGPDCPLALRPGTDDEVVWRSVMLANEYRLPDRFAPEDVVLDLGAHVGVFSHAALSRGSHHVIGYEAEEGNYQRAVANLGRWGDRVELHRQAVWRSDRAVESLIFHPSFDPGGTGGGNVVFADQGVVVPAVPFDDVVRALTDRHRRTVRFLKVDVEAAEFPILMTARTLDRVEEIAGEFHEVGGPHHASTIPERARIEGVPAFTVEALSGFLRAQGFAVHWVRSPLAPHFGLFFANRAGPFRRRVAAVWGRMKRWWRA